MLDIAAIYRCGPSTHSNSFGGTYIKILAFSLLRNRYSVMHVQSAQSKWCSKMEFQHLREYHYRRSLHLHHWWGYVRVHLWVVLVLKASEGEEGRLTAYTYATLNSLQQPPTGRSLGHTNLGKISIWGKQRRCRWWLPWPRGKRKFSFWEKCYVLWLGG